VRNGNGMYGFILVRVFEEDSQFMVLCTLTRIEKIDWGGWGTI
jgi:hypothetical protein